MKLIIQVPCFNEEASLPVTLASLPRTVPGIDRVEWLVIDDGSTDATTRVARDMGVHHLVRLQEHLGLAAAFKTGLEACLARGADIIVNTDADNQYRGEDIPQLIAPLLAGAADLVVGARPLRQIPHFSPLKRWLQIGGSWVVRRLSGTRIPDARSGFRALNRRLASRLDVFSRYTYTLETLIQAGREDFRVTSVPVGTNADLRPSRLIRNIPCDLWRCGATLIAASLRYLPLASFSILGTAAAGAAVTLGVGTMATPVLLTALSLGYLTHLLERNRRMLRDLRADDSPLAVARPSSRLRLVPSVP